MPCSLCKAPGHNARTCERLRRLRAIPCGVKFHPKEKSASWSVPPSQVESSTCAICLDEVGKSHSILPCGHVYCTVCFMQHATTNNKCPQCRAIIMEEKIPNYKEYKFIFIYAANSYMTSVRGNPTELWRQELCSISFDIFEDFLNRTNIACPPIYDEDGNPANWAAGFIYEGVCEYIHFTPVTTPITPPDLLSENEPFSPRPRPSSIITNHLDGDFENIVQSFAEEFSDEADINVNNGAGGSPVTIID